MQYITLSVEGYRTGLRASSTKNTRWYEIYRVLIIPFVAEVTGVLVASSSSDEESSEELLSALALAACVFVGGGVFTAGVLDCSSSSELLSLEDEDSAVFLAGVFAAEVGVCVVAFPLATTGLAGVFLASISESELSDESELLLSAFFALTGVTAGLAAAALGVTVVFTCFSSSLELSESLLDSAVALLAGAGGLAAEAGLFVGLRVLAAAGLGVLAAGASSSESELSVSESELLPAGLAAGLAGVPGLDTGVVAAFF